jgi:hypothetical protein
MSATTLVEKEETVVLPEEVPKTLRDALKNVKIETYEIIRPTPSDPILKVNGKIVGGWLDI